MRPRSPYLEKLMIPQMIDLIDRYGVDGFWIDGDLWAIEPCYCPRCEARHLSTRRKHWDIMLWNFYCSHGMGKPGEAKPGEERISWGKVLGVFYSTNIYFYNHYPLFRS